MFPSLVIQCIVRVTSETFDHRTVELNTTSALANYATEEENDGETVTEAAPAIGNWEEVTPDPAISYVDFVSVDEDVAVCGKVIDVDIVAKVLNNNIQAEDGASADKEYNSSVFQERLIPSAAEAIDHIQELGDFFESLNNSNYAKFLKTLHSEQVTKLQAKNQHECDLLEDIR
uniref:Uncharacterized protein n=1 Tax=Timema douglasi TaxID=61478 RepID=A0A7R8VDL4_TIMDO|nr:unnamed protein product [Timema douglasi]